MLTKDDKKYISETIGESITKNNGSLIKEIMELFNVTNKRIDDVDTKLSRKIDKVLDELKGHNDDIDNHERRIAKLEDKVFTTTTSPL